MSMTTSFFTKLFWKSFFDKTVLSLVGIGRVLRDWRYTLIAMSVAFLFGVMFSMLSVGTTEWNLLLSRLPLGEKVGIIGDAFVRLFADASTIDGVLLLVVVLLQGVTIALLVFSLVAEQKIKKQKQAANRRAGETAFASAVVTLGLGCSTCGASLIIPLLSVISTSAVFIGTVTLLITIVAIILLLYSSWKMGFSAYATTTAAYHQKEGGSNE